MTLLLRVVLPALELENDDLLVARVTDDLAGHLGAGEHGHARLHLVAVRTQKDLVELDRAPLVAKEAGNPNCLARLDTELLPAGADDSVAHDLRSEERRVGKVWRCRERPPHLSNNRR